MSDTNNVSEITLVKLLDKTTPQTFDDLAVDPNNPNTEVDGRDFLVWQKEGHPPATTTLALIVT